MARYGIARRFAPLLSERLVRPNALPVKYFSTKLEVSLMKIRFLVFLTLAIVVVAGPSRAASSANCSPGVGFIACQFVQGTTNVIGTFDFSATGDGIISFQFDAILASFELDVSAVR